MDENFEETVTCFLIVSILYTHSPTYAVVNVTEGLCHVELSIHVVNYEYIQRGPGEIHNPTQWNLIGRGVTAPPPVLSPSIIPPPSHCAFVPVRDIFDVLFKSVQFFTLLKTGRLKSRNLKLCKSGDVCVRFWSLTGS